MIYYVGIDISKYKHDFCIISSASELIVENFSFQNNKIGFQSLLDQLKPYNKSEIHIAFEATGHYSLNLELFLVNNGYSFMKVNPLIIHQFLKTRSLRRTKTDKADSLTIAKYLMSAPYKPNSDLLYTIFTLKSLCRARENLIKERSKFAILLTNELDKSFPELKPFFNNMISTTLLYILEKYTNTIGCDTVRHSGRGRAGGSSCGWGSSRCWGPPSRRRPCWLPGAYTGCFSSLCPATSRISAAGPMPARLPTVPGSMTCRWTSFTRSSRPRATLTRTPGPAPAPAG